jgi:pyridoxine 5-phosphate synthase
MKNTDRFPKLRLGVNIDHAATLRQARYRGRPTTCGEMIEPDPIPLAILAAQAGAHSITVHPREDARHIQREDVRRLHQCLPVPLNLEMAATDGMLEFALEIRPAYACLVPENREEVTTEGGLDVASQVDRIAPIVQTLTGAGIAVSLFIDPDLAQIEAARATTAYAIELHTGAFAEAGITTGARSAELERLFQAAEKAHALGLKVHAGHGINYHNVAEILQVPWVEELNIGHSILARSLFTGLPQAVREMCQAMLRS